MSKCKHNGKPEPVLPPIAITTDEARRLGALANSSIALLPRVTHLLADETERSKLVADDSDPRGIVCMGSQVRYHDIKTGDVREVVLVYPHEADSAETHLGAYVGRSDTDWPLGWSAHRIQDAGTSHAVAHGSRCVQLKIGSSGMRDVSTREATLTAMAIVIFLTGALYLVSVFKA
jgi:hypothetical protein